jgi:4'-phosphopantetheinyl transferase
MLQRSPSRRRRCNVRHDDCHAQQERMSRRPIEANEVHVWRFTGAVPAGSLPALAAVLNGDELRRSERLPAGERRTAFIAARGLLRHALASYLDAPADTLAFGYGALGKPFLSAPRCRLEFSLTHTRGLILLAVASGRRVGIDAEVVRPRRRAMQVAARLFAPRTSAVLDRLAGDEATRAFHSAWTLREAHVKAVGGGVYATPDVLPLLWPPPAGLTVRAETAAAESVRTWSVLTWCPEPEVLATVAAEGQVRQVAHRDCSMLLAADR